MNKEKDMAKLIRSMSGKYHVTQVFQDWIEIIALEMKIPHNETERENNIKRYCDLRNKYSEKENDKLSLLTSYLIDSLSYGINDILGALYMDLDVKNKKLGQIYTPWEVSIMMAKMMLKEEVNEEEVVKLLDPCCGSGGLLLASIKHLHDIGLNYQKNILIIAQDISMISVMMCYIQLQLLYVPAIVVCGDTLSKPFTGKFEGREWITLSYINNPKLWI